MKKLPSLTIDNQIKNSKRLKADIVIIGASLTGQLLAAVLQDKFNIYLVDEKLPIEAATKKGGRALALSYQSLDYLVKMGLFADLAELIASFQKKENLFSTIDVLNISQQGGSIGININHQEYDLPFLGVCVEANLLLLKLLDKNKELIKTNWLAQKLKFYQSEVDGVILTLENGDEIFSKLAIFASGNTASIRTKNNSQNFEIVNQGLNCSALVGSIDLALKAKAYQKYSENGVFALLPLSSKKAAFIYSFNNDVKNQLNPIFKKDNQLSKKAKEKIKHRFNLVFPKLLSNLELEDFKFGGLWPITSSYSKKVYQNRCLMMGASAVSFSPIAAQGFNLTIKDTFRLFQCLKNKTIEVEDLSAFAVGVESSHKKIRVFMNILEEVAFRKKVKNQQIISKILSVAFFSLHIPRVRDYFLSYFVGEVKKEKLNRFIVDE